MKIHPDKTRSYVQCKHCPDLQLTPNHILECPTVATKLLKMGMVPLRDSFDIYCIYSWTREQQQQPVVETTSEIHLPDPPSNQTTSQIYLPEPPSNQTTSQIYLPEPNVVEALEPTLTDDSSIDQIMSSVFGDYLPQGIPSAHSQDPQVLDTVPSLFDENNDLISFLDYFEAGLAMEQQETPMDLTMPRMKKKVINTTGFKVIKPLDLSIRNGLHCM
ncbi:hypothetical protein TNCV_91021 [Trichonephila clavipes]|nr:hypothetical protein TNCV_91021 [Trichonephila clavipes]